MIDRSRYSTSQPPPPPRTTHLSTARTLVAHRNDRCLTGCARHLCHRLRDEQEGKVEEVQGDQVSSAVE